MIGELNSKGYVVLEDYLTASEIEALRLVRKASDPAFFEAIMDLSRIDIQRDLQECDTLHEISRMQPAASTCIYEVLPGRSTDERTTPSQYHALRQTWPRKPDVWHLLFNSRLAQLVAQSLGQDAHLYNDQAGWRGSALTSILLEAAAVHKYHEFSHLCPP
jgi:hypothetical protein